VKSALERGLDPSGHRGKHPAFEQGREQHILVWIQENAEGRTPVTRKEIKDYCATQFQVPITRRCVNSFVLRSPGEIIQATSSSQEGQRLQVPRLFFE
jgi:transposase